VRGTTNKRRATIPAGRSLPADDQGGVPRCQEDTRQRGGRSPAIYRPRVRRDRGAHVSAYRRAAAGAFRRQLLLGLITRVLRLLSLGGLAASISFGLMTSSTSHARRPVLIGAFSPDAAHVLRQPLLGPLIMAPIIIGALGIAIERLFISRAALFTSTLYACC